MSETATPPTTAVQPNVSKTVPCISLATEDNIKCTAAARGEECRFAHAPPCLYSTKCHKKSDAEHMAQYYHPKASCKFGNFCMNTDDNHFLSFSHPCFVKECAAPTIGRLNGWVCGYHYRRMTQRMRMTRCFKNETNITKLRATKGAMNVPNEALMVEQSVAAVPVGAVPVPANEIEAAAALMVERSTAVPVEAHSYASILKK